MVWMIVRYKEIRCGSDVGISFKSAQIFDYRGRYETNDNCPGDNDLVCNYDPQQFMTYYRMLQRQIMLRYGSSVFNWVYPAGCMSLAQTTWPVGAECYTFYAEGPNAGQISSGGPLDKTLKLLPCEGENCCRFTYTYNDITGQFTMVQAPPDIPCPGVLTIVSDTLVCQDSNNVTQTYIGVVDSSGPCQSLCLASVQTLFKTDAKGTTGFQPLPPPDNFKITPHLPMT
jgi:hypothetical protein